MSAVRAFARASLERYVVALEYPEFRTMWLAHLAAQAAGWALIVARGWLVFDLTHSSFVVGLVTFAAMAPMLIMPPIAGVLADRMDRRTLLASTYVVNMAITLVLAALAAIGTLNEWTVFALTLGNGAARATQQATSQALAANLVPRERLLNALSLTAATQHMAKLIGPGLVAPVLGLIGVAPAFFLCAALYGLGWVQLQGIRTRTTGGVRRGESFAGSFVAGIAYSWRQPLIRMVLVMVFFHCGLTMAYESLMPNYFTAQFGGTHQTAAGGLAHHDHDAPAPAEPASALAPHDHDAPAASFDGQATGFAALMMAVGFGALFGSLLIGGVQGGLMRGRLYLGMGVLSGLGLVAMAWAPSVLLAYAAAALVGGSQAAFMTMGQALMQSLAADAYRGRIASMNTLSFGGIMAVMNLSNGALGTQFSAGSILLVDGLAFVAVMLGSLAFSTPRRVYVRGMPARTLAAEAPAAVPAR